MASSSEPLPPRSAELRLSRTDAYIYGLPTVAIGFMLLPIMILFMRYCTDVLLIAPGAISLIILLSRAWDAVSDPWVGYLSDRVQGRWGRRRPWMAFSCVPLAVLYFMLWSPPVELDDLALLAWMTVASFVFFTAATTFMVPHQALGAELSTNSADRTRAYGMRHIGFGIGAALGIGSMALIDASSDPRVTASRMAIAAGALALVLILFATYRLQERSDYSDRGGRNPWASYLDVLRNPHARLLLAVTLLTNAGMGTLAITTPYLLKYTLGGLNLLIPFSLYFVPAYILAPVWWNLATRFGKRRLWVAGLWMSAVAFASLFLVGPSDLVLLGVIALAVGAAGGCVQVMAPSMLADVIDFDEYSSGERKEGSYFAASSLAVKLGIAMGAGIVGGTLEGFGFEANVEQTETVKTAILATCAFVPAAGYAAGAVVLNRFTLTEHDHRRIRGELDRRPQ